MSRQAKPSPQATPTVPGAVAQQAQQYLEQNIMAWMQPKPQGQSIVTSTGHVSMSQKALQEHNMAQQSSPKHSSQSRPAYLPAAPSVAGTSCIGIPPSSCIPHSLSFSGYSHHSLLQGTSFSSPCPSVYGPGASQPSAAASFFARAAQRLNLSSKKRRRQQHLFPHVRGHGAEVVELPCFRTNFCDVLRSSAPSVPPSLLRSLGRKENFALGKVKVMLRIAPSSGTSCEASPFLNVDSRKKQLTVFDPTLSSSSPPADRNRTTSGISAPKMFAFDAIFSPDDTQTEVCSSSLPEVIQSVVGGSDGCLFVYGHSKLGKTHTMIGSSDSVQGLGVIPCAISWLFRLIHEQRQKTGARFSVRLSAIEISGRNEVLTDLLSEYAAGTEGSGTSPGVYLREDPVLGAQLINASELRAPSAEKAGYLLDAALAARNADEDEAKDSHFLFTLHVYQYRVDRSGKGGVAGGRSRLHLFDLGSCEKTQVKPRDMASCNVPTSLSFSALGNVILALFNGQKHLPNKESKLTQMLREATNSLTCRVTMIAHVSSSPQHYSEVLATVQLAARIHRMRRKKIKGPSNVTMENVYDEKGACVRPFVRMHAEDGMKNGNSDADYTSSSEQSCDTVIFVGSGRMSLSDRRQPDHSAQTVSKLNHQKSPNSESKDTNASGNSTSQRKQEALRDTSKHLSPANSKISREESNCNSNTKDCAASRLKQQPASTQTPRTECTNSPLKVSTAPRKKHKTTASKQDGIVSKEQQQIAFASKTVSTKESKPQSDETWIDGPRFSKPKFDSKTLHRLQKEQWVDGPPVIYGFMDDHKQSMIRKWVEEHSNHLENKGQAWVDPHAKSEDKKDSLDSFVPPIDSTSKEGEEKIINVSNKTSSKDEPEYAIPCRVRSKQFSSSTLGDNKHDNISQGVTEYSCFNADLNSDHDEVDSASNSADVDETDNEENLENGAYDTDLQYALSTGDEYNREVETIEVVEPDEPVPTMDSCLQVNEEDIIAECWFQSVQDTMGNPFADRNRQHPLRVLSEEGLNLPSSFSDSRSVSIDLDSVSVPDTCKDLYRGKGGVTWRLLYGNMFQKIKEQQQLKQMNISEAANDVPNSSVDEKLRQISRLRELVRPLTKRERPEKASLPLSLPSFRSKPDAWPSDISCYALSEMMRGSSDSSLSEDLSEADINSTKSEPAELDLDKYDFKFNVKPMNGLKLEAFYNKIHKVPPFSKHYDCQKPTQIVPPLISDEENKQLLDKIESYQLEGFTKERSNSFSHRPPLKTFIRDTLEAPPFLRRPTFSSFHGKFETTSNPQLHQSSFLTNASKTSISVNSSDSVSFLAKNDSSIQRNSEISKIENLYTSESVGIFKRTELKSKTSNLISKAIDIRQLTVGSSPTNSAKTKTSQRSKLSDCSKSTARDQPPPSSSNSSIQNKDLSFSCSSISSKATPQRTVLNGSSKPSHGKHSNNNNINYCSSAACQSKTNGCNKRTSPTSNGSSTSGITTTCCSTVKQREKPGCAKGKSFQQDQSKHKRCESKRQVKNVSTKSICRSTSSPSTCVDSGDTALTDVTDGSDHYFVSRHASISNTLAPSSPYHKIVQSRYHNHSHHHRHHKQRTSSGNGSDDSSVNSLEPREAKDMIVIKGTTKPQQFSGTSSGYESMLRDSEGTPLSSSQESGTEGSVGRGRKGRRKSQGSSKRSLSAPARSPASSTSASRLPATVNQQPSSDNNGGAVLLLRPRTALDRRSDEEICCPSLLCCRLLDFY